VTVTGNAGEPCPLCDGTGHCDASAVNAGAACTPNADTRQSHDCQPSGIPLSPFAVDLTGLTTGTSSRTDAGGMLCSGQGAPGALGDPAVRTIAASGSVSGGVPAVLASVFCIPATGNALIDAAVGLPGPGAITLPVATTFF